MAAQVPQFQVGQRVVINNPDSMWHGQHGTVMSEPWMHAAGVQLIWEIPVPEGYAAMAKTLNRLPQMFKVSELAASR